MWLKCTNRRHFNCFRSKELKARPYFSKFTFLWGGGWGLRMDYSLPTADLPPFQSQLLNTPPTTTTTTTLFKYQNSHKISQNIFQPGNVTWKLVKTPYFRQTDLVRKSSSFLLVRHHFQPYSQTSPFHCGQGKVWYETDVIGHQRCRHNNGMHDVSTNCSLSWSFLRPFCNRWFFVEGILKYPLSSWIRNLFFECIYR